MTFLATTVLYPCALGLLCVGAGLLVDRACGGLLAAALLPSVGAAALIALSQLTTFVVLLAPATPYLMAALAALGLALGRDALLALARASWRRPLPALATLLAYVLALAPVLLAGRPTFSSFMALSDSAVHLIGADYLIHHGQSYAHLDLASSYGRFLKEYYGTSYPSGADTLFGGSALLLGLSLMWAFQPFNAFVLALACPPAWMLARRLGLAGGWAAAAALAAVLGALVYGYELIGSVKELTALSMLLTSACLASAPSSWLRRGPRAAVPLALVLAAGVSALGVAFGVWAIVAALVVLAALLAELRAGRVRVSGAALLIAVGVAAGALAALPTWADLGGSLQVAGNIASTSNPGNLHTALRATQALGVWLGQSYKTLPTGVGRHLTDALVAVSILAAVLGGAQALRRRAWLLAGWIALVLLAWLLVSVSVTTWASAKTLMLTSPVVVLLAWAGVAFVRELPVRGAPFVVAAVLASLLAGGTLASDALQYRSSNLAPSARYEELASLDARFAGQGPALFTDFDEYSLYELRDLDVGGPDFVYPPPAAAAAAGGYGQPVDLGRAPPRALNAFPLIVTRRDPLLPRPPAAYALAWSGVYYEVWRRRAGAPAARVHVALAGSAAMQCRQIAAAVGATDAGRETVAVAGAPAAVRAELASAPAPRGWGRDRRGLAMGRAGTLRVTIAVPHTGRWRLWLQGQFMPRVTLAVDGRRVASVSGQLSGNSLVPDTVAAGVATLTAGPHVLAITRTAPGWGPGARGAAVLAGAFLTPLAAAPVSTLRSGPAAAWRGLCGRRYEWLEIVPR